MSIEVQFNTIEQESIVKENEVTYADAHDAASGDAIATSSTRVLNTRLASLLYDVGRSFLAFDLSSLAGETILSAYLYPYISSALQADIGHSDLCIVEGVQNVPAILSDFGAHLTKTTIGGKILFGDITDNARNRIDFNATGLTWLVAGAISKVCLRISGDIDNLTPTGVNMVRFPFVLAHLYVTYATVAGRSQGILID